MKKRVLAFLLCLLMAFSTVDTGIISSSLVIEASAVSIEALKTTLVQIPDKSQWESLYVDSSTLSMWYDSAQQILENPSAYSQSYIDNIEKSLDNAYKSLKYHTQTIALNKTKLTLSVGQSYTLKAFLDPENSADEISWSSSDKNAVSVSSDGSLKVNKYSSKPVTVYATSNGKSATCVITITNPLSSVALNVSSKTVYDTQGFQLSVVAKGVDTSASCSESVTYTWKSSAPTVASVSETGYVTGRTRGTATITVTAKSDTNTVTASCVVTVNELIEISSLVLQNANNNGVITMVVGETRMINVKIVPENASIKNISWTNSDSSVLSFSGDTVSGSNAFLTVKALKAGKANVTYTAKDSSGKSGVVTVEVLPLVSFVSLSETVKVVSPTSTGEKLVATVLPANAGNKVLEWSSSDPNICQVDNAGVLIPKKVGVCTITAKTTDSSKLSASCKVRVAPRASSVSINRTLANLEVGETVKLSATVITQDGLNYNDVEWISENTNIATVSASGVVTAKYPGTVKIKAVALDGTEKSAVCVVEVTQSVKSVSLPSAKTLGVKTSTTLTAQIVPSYATNKKVTWKSSDTSVATVDQNGKVTAKDKVGSCKITVTTADGGHTAVCVINVVVPTTSISLSQTSLSLKAGATASLKATVQPSNATDKTVRWSSSDTSVATVTSSGVVTAIAGGKCTITATSSGGQKVSCNVSVSQDATGITLDKNILTLYAGQTSTLNASLIPSTATTTNFVWKSNNPAVLSVVGTGRSARLTAIKKGVAVITVSVGSISASCTVNVVPKIDVTGVSIPSSLYLLKGETKAVDVNVTPSNASNKEVTWSTSNGAVATVSAQGIIKAVGTGTAVITVKTKDGGFSDTCNVTVTQKVSGIKLSCSAMSVNLGKSRTLVATILPSDATNKKVVWESSNPSVATVTQSGVVKGVKIGSATITATTADGGYTASCNVVINVGVTGVKLSSTALTVPRGESRMLTAIISPSNATDQTVTFASSDSKVAYVNAAGQITGRKNGTAVITVKTADGSFKASCTVTVVTYATSVSIDYKSVSLNVGKTKTLTAKVKPNYVSNSSIKWSSTNKKVATVNKKGKITAVAAGTAVIKATSGDGKAYAVCSVTVIQPVKSVKFSEKSYSVKIGQLKVLSAVVSPADATYNTITWSSSNEKIATVDKDGVVKGLKKGTVTITASCENGRVKATCKVHVKKSVKGVSLDKTSVTLAAGKKVTLNASVVPASASNQKVTWSSNNYDVATVDKNGVVTAKSSGYAEITAKSKDGGYTAICRITVIEPVKGVKLKTTKKTLDIKESVTLKAVIKPKKATNQKLIWTSSNKKVVKVNSKGKITGLKKGSATITVKTADGGYVATCKVTVLRKVKDVTLNKTSMVLYLTDTATLKATVTPKNATNKAVSWKSSNKEVLKVSKKGKLTPVKPGKATITVKTKQGGLVAKCVVSVEREVKSLKLNKSSLTLEVGQSFNLVSTISPKNATNKTVSYTTSNKAVATVTSNGVIKAVGGGTATIYAKTSNAITKKCVVNVLQNVQSVRLNKSTLSLYTGTAESLVATVLPAGANNKNVKWTSSNTAVARVDAKGRITAIKAGKAVISVITADGGYKASCTVNVLQHVTGVKFNEAKKEVAKGKSVTIAPVVLPLDATNKSVTYASSNPSVAAITPSGVLTAYAVGETVITVTTKDKGYKATLIVNVVEPVTSVAVNPEITTIFAGDALSLQTAVSPTDATNKLIRYSSSDSLIASVSSTGVITAKKSGTCIITATTVDGGYKASCAVTVLQKATGISIDKDKCSLDAGQTAQLTATVLPADSYNKNVSWSSDNEEVLTVDENGIIKALVPGIAKIKAVSDDGGFSAYCVVTVTRAVSGVNISHSSITLYKDETKTLTATVTPEDATNKSLVWKSSDEKIATVKDGVVTAVSKGSAVISVEALNGGYKAVCKVDVILHAESIKLSHSEISINENATEKLIATVLPTGAENKTVLWFSDDESIAKVEDGIVTGLRKGTTVIRVVSAENDKIVSECRVDVKKPVSSVNIEGESAVLYKNETITLKAAVSPEDASNRNILWSSSNEGVAKVNENGVVTAVSRGNAVITATSEDGHFTDSFAVEVKQYIEEIKTQKDTYIISTYESVKIQPEVLPENANDTSLSFSSDDESVAKVDESGVVYGYKKGKVTITIKANSGKVQKKVSVEVIEPATSVIINETVPELWVGDTFTLSATVLPENATYKNVTWSSSNENVVTVKDGVLTALGAGEATVTALSMCEKAKATVKIVVKQQVNEIKLSAYSVTLDENKDSEDNKIKLTATVLPENAYNKAVHWYSFNESVAKVSDDGTITAVGAGKTQVSATSADGKITARCNVIVVKQVTDIKLSSGEITIENGETATITATVIPADATDLSVKWYSSDKSVASVDENGVVTAKKAGTATITAVSSKESVRAICKVNVTQLPQSITLSALELKLSEKESKTLSVSYSPVDTTQKSLIWKSSNNAVATVENGKVTAVSKGVCQITVESAYNKDIKAVCQVTVRRDVAGVEISEKSKSLYVGQNASLTATVLPLGADNQKVTWLSSDPSVLKVDSEGKITALKYGMATVSVITDEGEFKSACLVSVKNFIEKITFDTKAVLIGKRESVKLSVTLSPVGADKDDLLWKSNNTAVATVDQNGTVTAGSTGGEAVITAYSKTNEKVMATKKITVKEEVTSVNLSDNYLSKKVGETYQLTAIVFPQNATNKKLIWKSSDEKVATVDQNGLVRFISAGTANITVVSAENGDIKKVCAVVVS